MPGRPAETLAAAAMGILNVAYDRSLTGSHRAEVEREVTTAPGASPTPFALGDRTKQKQPVIIIFSSRSRHSRLMTQLCCHFLLLSPDVEFRRSFKGNCVFRTAASPALFSFQRFSSGNEASFPLSPFDLVENGNPRNRFT
jgi:hypothetical protein